MLLRKEDLEELGEAYAVPDDDLAFLKTPPDTSALKVEYSAPNWSALPQQQQHPSTPRLKRPVENPSDGPRPPVRRRPTPFDQAAQKPFIRHRGRDPAPPIPAKPPAPEWIPPLRQASPPAMTHTSVAITTDNYRQIFAAVPDMVNTNRYMRITIEPQIKRKQEGGFSVQVGLKGRRDGSYKGSVKSMYDRINPNVITTGIPAEPPESQPPKADEAQRDDQGPILKEMVLVRKDKEARLPDEVFRAAGPFSGDTCVIPPWIRWPGFWLFDVFCKGDGRSEVILKKRLTSRFTLQVTGDEEDYWIKKTDLQEGSAID